MDDPDAALLARGQERFGIFCTPCHGLSGEGNGMIVQRGFPPPPSFHTRRLRAVPARYLFDVITEGYGVMYSYAATSACRTRDGSATQGKSAGMAKASGRLGS